MVKAGDVVKYSIFGRTLNAIVLSTRSGEVSHLGADGEPLVALAFIDPDRETGLSRNKETGEAIWPAGRIPQVFLEHDVVHASHEFSQEFKAAKGIRTPADIASVRGHGEYTEFESEEAETVRGVLVADIGAASVAAAIQSAAEVDGEKNIDMTQS